jgi:hypothetical protein
MSLAIVRTALSSSAQRSGTIITLRYIGLPRSRGAPIPREISTSFECLLVSHAK